MIMYVSVNLNQNVVWFDASRVREDAIAVDLQDEKIEEIFTNGFKHYQFIKNEFIFLEDSAKQEKIDIIKSRFREWRAYQLQKYDLIRQCALNQDIDPKTNEIYPPFTEEEKQWRLDLLNFTDLINENTTIEDYPLTPTRFL